MTSTLAPIEEARAELDSPDAVAERRKRGETIYSQLTDFELRKLEMGFTVKQLECIELPFKTPYRLHATDPKWAAGRAAWLADALGEFQPPPSGRSASR
jgi:hypothetical protein